jgi:SIR2-like domain/Effector-associated domain 11
VSANPDKSLADAFAKYRLPHQFDYYSSQPKDYETALTRPTGEQPLLYNLCGSYEDRKSLILDYDDLFNLLRNLLADNKVPVSEVRRPLQSATTFIFFGFHFERWYTQLFLRYLNQNEHQFSNNARNYALKTTFSDAESQQFFIKQFNVRYIGGDAAFFEEMHRRFSEKYPQRMRRLVDELSPTATTVVQLIERNDVDAAISKLKPFEAQLSADDRELLSQTEAMYHHYLQEKQEPAITQEHLTMQLNRVRKNLRFLAQKLK